MPGVGSGGLTWEKQEQAEPLSGSEPQPPLQTEQLGLGRLTGWGQGSDGDVTAWLRATRM